MQCHRSYSSLSPKRLGFSTCNRISDTKSPKGAIIKLQWVPLHRYVSICFEAFRVTCNQQSVGDRSREKGLEKFKVHVGRREYANEHVSRPEKGRSMERGCGHDDFLCFSISSGKHRSQRMFSPFVALPTICSRVLSLNNVFLLSFNFHPPPSLFVFSYNPIIPTLLFFFFFSFNLLQWNDARRESFVLKLQYFLGSHIYNYIIIYCNIKYIF